MGNLIKVVYFLLVPFVQLLICFYIMLAMATIKFNYNFHVAAVVGHLPSLVLLLLHPGNLVDFDINHSPI